VARAGLPHDLCFDGYATVAQSEAGHEWVCQRCFNDFAEELELVIDGPGAATNSPSPTAFAAVGSGYRVRVNNEANRPRLRGRFGSAGGRSGSH
jgi:hypothetical protein